MKQIRVSYVTGVCVWWLMCVGALAAQNTRQALVDIWDDLPRSQLCLAPCDLPPVIDGKLDDAAWQVASVATQFIQTDGSFAKRTGGLDAADAESEIFVTYDATHLYLAARMSEPDMAYLVSASENRDDHAWEDDCLEWFLDRDKQGSDILQIIVNCAGVIWDGHHAKGKIDVSWTCEGLRVATGQGTDEWYIEMAIPYEGLGMPVPTRGALWRTSFGRERYTTLTGRRRELSTWVGQPESYFNTPSRFGQFRFGDLALTAYEMPQAHFGVLETKLAFLNRGSKAMDLKLVPMSTSPQNTGEVVAVTVEAKSRLEVVVPMLIEAEGTHFNAIAVYHGRDLMAAVRRVYDIPLLTEDAEARLAYARMLRKAESQTEAFRHNMAVEAKALEAILREANQIKRALNQHDAKNSKTDEAWSKLVARFEQIDVPKPPPRPQKSVWK